jgi:hypothetical protein
MCKKVHLVCSQAYRMSYYIGSAGNKVNRSDAQVRNT